MSITKAQFEMPADRMWTRRATSGSRCAAGGGAARPGGCPTPVRRQAPTAGDAVADVAIPF